MKLLFCKACNDIIQLRDIKRFCSCKQCSGKYTDDIMAEVSGPCEVICFGNKSFYAALKGHEKGGGAKHFTAWINREGEANLVHVIRIPKGT